MADALISVLVDQIVFRSLQKIEGEVKLANDAKSELQKVKKSLRLIQALLEDAGKKQLESASVKQWLSDLEEVSYDMDDLLGEWNAAILMSEIEREWRKVGSLFPSFCFCFKQSVREFISLREFAKEIEKRNAELDVIKRLGNELGIVSRVVESSDQHRASSSSARKPRNATTSFINETKIQGRVQEKAVLVSKLVCASSDGDGKGKGIEVVPIVGLGGLGKTTLAQMAYNDDRVKAHFHARIWVCVSDPFDLFNIAKCVVEGLGGKPSDYVSLEAMMQFIYVSIAGKMFLLVLDDVWSKDGETWNQLHEPLQNGGYGSRILLTTRNKEVAMMMGLVSADKIETLETLSDEQCWSIIKQLALTEEEEEEESNKLQQLEVIGKKIASKCSGLPLAAKILGGLMCIKKSYTQWEDILYSQLWESNAFDKIFAALLMSYYDLSHVEKCCFLYCSGFPKDQVIDVAKLVEMWISQGYFDESSKGLECFESLAMRSFFQDFQTTDICSHSCKMHDIVHDFAQYLTRDKFVIMEGDISIAKIESLDGQARHLTMILNPDCQFPTSKLQEMNLACKFRSLCVQSHIFSETTSLEFLNLSCFRALRTLNLENYRYEGETIAHKFLKMVHLRFLDLSGMYWLKELPESLCDLCNLLTLRLIGCYSLKRLSARFGKLVNLRHLYVSWCNCLKGFPIGFENLTRLQSLDAVLVPENKEAYFGASDLRKLGRLRFQGILSVDNCSNFTDNKEAEKLSIKTMKELSGLNLIFEEDDSRIEIDKTAILEALKPHPNLSSMRIRNYNGSTLSPTWLLSLTNLKVLFIIDCRRCEILPPLGRLPLLETLTLLIMKSVKKVGLEFLGLENLRDSGGECTTPFVSFPRLKELKFKYMPNWIEWEDIREAARPSFLSVMPRLRFLTLDCCRLKTLPDFLLMTPLQSLSTPGCESLEKWCREGERKQWLEKLNY